MTPQQQTTDLAPVERQEYAIDWYNPKSFNQAVDMANRMAKSQLVPTAYRQKPDDIVVAWSLGAPLGLSLLSSLQHIAVINGRPCLWGDGMLAICRAHPAFEWIHEELVGEGDDQVAVCRVKRRGEPKAVERTFSVQDAKRAKLWGDSRRSPWLQYPQRMLQMRARGFALRDAFADALSGMAMAEEVRDIPPEDVRVTDAEDDGSTRTEKLKRRIRKPAGEEKPQEGSAPDVQEEMRKSIAEWARAKGYAWEDLQDFIEDSAGVKVERMGDLHGEGLARVAHAITQHDKMTEEG